MVSLDTESQAFFSRGTEIEVTSDEEGFRGAWYRATILESPPKSSSKKRKKALVEYKYLVTEDGSTPLAEYVDPAYIRPLPPQQEGGKDVFELNDVVEANYRDGWWTGTVRKVLENGKFRVCFDNPPDVLDFDANDLRVHYEWDNGNWVRPEKQQSTGSIFSPGTVVEVNIENKENLRDVWFPAIVIKENEDGTFYVKYQNSRNNDEAATVKVTLDSQHIRPTPPRYLDRNYELLEKVDASYGLGWRAGVITKVLAGGRYNVFFKQGNEDKELSHSDIRPHVEWAGGTWISKSKEVLIACDNQEQLGHAHEGSDNPEVALKLESLGSGKDNSEEQNSCLTNIRKNQMEQSTPSHEDSAGYALPSSKKKMKSANSNGTPVDSHPNKMQTEGNASDAPLSVTASHVRKIPDETTAESDDVLATPKTERAGTKISKKPVVVAKPAATVESPFLGKRIKIKQQKFGVDFETSDPVKKRGRPAKLQTKSLPALVTGKESTTTLTAAGELNENNGKRKEAEMPVILGLKAKVIRGTQVGNYGQVSDEVSLKLIRDKKKNVNDSGRDSNLPKSGGSSQRRKRGRPRKLVVISPRALDDGKDHKGVAGVVGEVVKDRTTDEIEFHSIKRVESTVNQDASGDKRADFPEGDCSIKEVDMAIAVVSNDTADDDQPLSTWIGGMHSSSVEELRLSNVRNVNVLDEARERQVENVTKSSVIDWKGDNDPAENQMLPFVKKSPIWETIESMEVFQIVPQNPHFRPLAETKEEYREGSAVGIMVTYAGLFEKISMLQLHDSRSVFNRTLESLLDLEKHGFDITLLRHRVTGLLSIRDGQGRFLDELKDAEREMIEHTSERTKLEEEIVEIGRKISELQEQLDSKTLSKQKEDVEIARLQSLVCNVKERIQSGRCDFENLAGAPWKSP